MYRKNTTEKAHMTVEGREASEEEVRGGEMADEIRGGRLKRRCWGGGAACSIGACGGAG